MCCSLHSSFAKAAAQQGAKVTKYRLAADDKNPWIHYGVEGVKTESCQVLLVIGKWMNSIDETCNSERQGADHKDDGDERQEYQVIHLLFALSKPGQAYPPPSPR